MSSRTISFRASAAANSDLRSALVERITSTDEDEVMPPPKSGKKLTPEQIEKLRTWIAEGANWQNHWSLIPPVRSPLPTVKYAQ